MGTRSPPDGWTLPVGTWGVDADREETILLSGVAGLRFKNTAVATKIVSPFYSRDFGAVGDLTSIFSTNPFVMALFAVVRADSAAVGNNVIVQVKGYAADRTTLLETTTLQNGVIAANVWTVVNSIVPSNALSVVYVQFEISKSATAFNVYIDRIEYRKQNPSLFAMMSGVQVIPTAVFTTVLYNAIDSQHGYGLGVPYAAGTGIATLYYPGYYLVTASVWMTFSNNKQICLRLVDADSGNFIWRGGTFTSSQNTTGLVEMTAIVAGGVGLTKRIRVECFQDSGGNQNVQATLSKLRILRMGDL